MFTCSTNSYLHNYMFYMCGDRKDHCIDHLAMVTEAFGLDGALKMLITSQVTAKEITNMLTTLTMDVCFELFTLTKHAE